jgi:hypothetical protein
VIRIFITADAFAALGGTDMALQNATDGSGRYGSPPEGQVAVWLPNAVLEALRASRGRNESYSAAIIRLVGQEKEIQT